MAKCYLTKFYFFVVCSLICGCTAEDTCIKSGPCLCEVSDEKYINISDILNAKKYITSTNGNLTYYFAGCSSITSKEMGLSPEKNGCEKPTSLCMYDVTNNSTRNFGLADGNFTIKDGITSLVLSNTTNHLVAFVALVCTNLNESFLVFKPPSSNHHNLILFSPHACYLTHYHGLSTGSVLLILFFLGLGVYFIGGALVLHFLRGARGKEMIPNYDFWMGLPSLIRDGVLFLFNGCTPVNVPTSESYDRI